MSSNEDMGLGLTVGVVASFGADCVVTAGDSAFVLGSDANCVSFFTELAFGGANIVILGGGGGGGFAAAACAFFFAKFPFIGFCPCSNVEGAPCPDLEPAAGSGGAELEEGGIELSPLAASFLFLSAFFLFSLSAFLRAFASAALSLAPTFLVVEAPAAPEDAAARAAARFADLLCLESSSFFLVFSCFFRRSSSRSGVVFLMPLAWLDKNELVGQMNREGIHCDVCSLLTDASGRLVSFGSSGSFSLWTKDW